MQYLLLSRLSLSSLNCLNYWPDSYNQRKAHTCFRRGEKRVLFIWFSLLHIASRSAFILKCVFRAIPRGHCFCRALRMHTSAPACDARCAVMRYVWPLRWLFSWSTHCRRLPFVGAQWALVSVEEQWGTGTAVCRLSPLRASKVILKIYKPRYVCGCWHLTKLFIKSLSNSKDVLFNIW